MADEEQAHHARPAGAGSGAKNCPCSWFNACAEIDLANDEGDIAAGGGLRDQPDRHVANALKHLTDQPRIRLQAVADDADDGHVVLGVHVRELRQRLDDGRQSPPIVDRHRHRDLRGA